MKARFALFLVAAAPFLVGCQDSYSPVGPNAIVSPTPTPLPPGGNIAGAWTGEFYATDVALCWNGASAQASFSQNGSNVSGTLSANDKDCGFTALAFEGTLQGNVLDGTLKGGFPWGTARGSLSGTNLKLTLTNPGGEMTLHR